MGKRAEPKENIEYVFKFRKGNVAHTTTLIYEGVNEKGRYEFFNKDTGAYTSMPPERFSYIHRFNLVSEQAVVQEKPKPSRIEREQAERVKKEKEEKAKGVEFDKQNLRCLNSFTEREKTQAREKLGIVIENLIEKFKSNDWEGAEAIKLLNLTKLFPDKPWAI